MSAFEMLKALPLGTKVTLTADGYDPLPGEVGALWQDCSNPDEPAKDMVLIWTGPRRVSWLEITAQSDVEYDPAACVLKVN